MKDNCNRQHVLEWSINVGIILCICLLIWCVGMVGSYYWSRFWPKEEKDNIPYYSLYEGEIRTLAKADLEIEIGYVNEENIVQRYKLSAPSVKWVRVYEK